MAVFDEATQNALARKLEQLNSNFSEADFLKLCQEAKAITANVFFPEIERWLLAQAEKKMFVAYGVLAQLYLAIKDFANAKEFALMANDYFPDTEIWQEIINEAIYCQFEDEVSNSSSD